MELKWKRLRPGVYRTIDGKFKVERTQQGDGWHLFGPDADSGEEIYYGTYAYKAEAQEGATI